MKTALILAAVLAAGAAQAQQITSIARFGTHTVALSDMQCPTDSWSRVAVYNAYTGDRGRAYGCYSGVSGREVSLTWFKVTTTNPLPRSIPTKDFQSATE